MRKRTGTILVSALCSAVMVGCNSSDSDDAAQTKNAVIEFAAMVGNSDFECGNVYQNVGIGSNEYLPQDFRLYISNVALKTDQDEEISVTLTEDDAWKYDNVALLDFETGTADGCNGTAETNNQITATYEAPTAGNIVGLCFDLGVPFEHNHLDTATSPSPLNASGMFWKWLSGHKFVRIDGKGDPNGANVNFPIHIGSTGCTYDTGEGNDMTAPPTSECTYSNTPRICLDSFDMETQVVTIDPAAILANTDITAATPNTAPGCMSGNNDPECSMLMPRLGINFVYNDGSGPVTYNAETQSFFGLATK